MAVRRNANWVPALPGRRKREEFPTVELGDGPFVGVGEFAGASAHRRRHLRTSNLGQFRVYDISSLQKWWPLRDSSALSVHRLSDSRLTARVAYR